eukprot:546885-Amphidinium_carterae.1
MSRMRVSEAGQAERPAALVTGARGFLGKYIVRTLLEQTNGRYLRSLRDRSPHLRDSSTLRLPENMVP